MMALNKLRQARSCFTFFTVLLSPLPSVFVLYDVPDYDEQPDEYDCIRVHMSSPVSNLLTHLLYPHVHAVPDFHDQPFTDAVGKGAIQSSG